MKTEKSKTNGLRPGQITGWKNYGVAVLCIIAGLWAFHRGDMDGAVKGILAGLVVISFRDVLGKVLSAVDANSKLIEGLRAAIEAELSTRRNNP